MLLRRARTEDSAVVAALFRRSFGTLTFLPTLHTPDEDRHHFADAIARAEVWIAEEDGRMRGFVTLTGNVLDAFYVEPEAQGQGVGSALLAKAKELRPAGLRLWVFQRNTHARRFYERRGFRPIQLTDGSGNEEQEPDALYAWEPEG